MAGRKTKASDQQLRDERLQLARLCRDPMLLEGYLRSVEDALRVKASESENIELSIPVLNTELVLTTNLSVPAFTTGLSVPSLSKIPRGQLLFAIKQAFHDATILFPKGLTDGIQIVPTAMPPRETLAAIALSPLTWWMHAALADALNGGKPDVFFNLLAQTLRDLTKPDEESTPIAYVTMVHKATIELVREAYQSHKETGKPEPWEVLEIPTFMPTKLEVKRKAVAMFGKLVPDIGRKRNRETGRYESRDQLWTRIFAIAGLRALIDSRGQHLRKKSKKEAHPKKDTPQYE
jgi:hypothetical protein